MAKTVGRGSRMRLIGQEMLRKGGGNRGRGRGQQHRGQWRGKGVAHVCCVSVLCQHAVSAPPSGAHRPQRLTTHLQNNSLAAHVAHLLDGRAVGAVVRVPVQQLSLPVLPPRGQLGHVDAAADDLRRAADPGAVQQVVLERICTKAVQRWPEDALPAQLANLGRGNASALAARPVVRAHRALVQVLGHAVDALLTLERTAALRVAVQHVTVGAAPRISDVDVFDARVTRDSDRLLVFCPICMGHRQWD
eukprot:361223-Chlamydomonas_euryale.AAC.1